MNINFLTIDTVKTILFVGLRFLLNFTDLLLLWEVGFCKNHMHDSGIKLGSSHLVSQHGTMPLQKLAQWHYLKCYLVTYTPPPPLIWDLFSNFPKYRETLGNDLEVSNISSNHKPPTVTWVRKNSYSWDLVQTRLLLVVKRTLSHRHKN